AALKNRGFTVTKLLNTKATGAGMRAAMKAVITQAKSGDTVVIQYSGHGSQVPDENGDEADGTDEVICPRDVVAKGPITDDELFQIYQARASGVRLIMISDSCNSGTVTKFAPIKAGAKRSKVRFMPPATFLS